MKRTPLFDAHVDQGARLVEFAGWEMPLHYRTGINEEHLAVRGGVGIFDVSHMGELRITGPHAVDLLRWAALNDAGILKPGRAHYSMLPNDRGGLIDDIYIYRLGADEFRVVCNAANRILVYEHLSRLAGSHECEVEDVADGRALIALQGPGSAVMLERHTGLDLTAVRKNSLLDGEIATVPARLARTGYTGEDGFEIFVPAEGARSVWDALTAAGATPCGLGARDTLRLEAGFPLFGAELDGTTNPRCTPFAWVVKDKPVYGRERLWNQECVRKLVGLRLLQRGIARHGYRLFDGPKEVGEVTSGTISPVTRDGIAMAWVDREYSEPGREISVEIRGQPVPAVVSEMPFIEG